MNTLLHIADSVLQYHRGRQTGLWGLIGIALGILAVVFWDKVLPFFEFIGLVDFFESIGILHTNAPYMSAFKVFMFFFMASILFMALGWVVLGIFGVVMGIAQNSLMQKLFIGLIGIILSPLIIVIMLYYLIFSKSTRAERTFMQNDPEGYKDMMRLKRNKVEIDYLKFGPNSDKENTITYTEAFNCLNRLPTDGDHSFLMGVTYDRDVFMLLPCCLTALGWKNPGDVYCIPLELESQYFHETKDKIKIVEFLIKIDRLYDKHKKDSIGRFRLQLKDFEEIINPSNIPQMNTFFIQYKNTKEYREYVKSEQAYFFNKKRFLIEELQEITSEVEYKSKLEELQSFNVPNEDIVRTTWEAHKA